MQLRLGLLISGLFLFSGATALVYQVAWTRNLSLIFGASHQAISIVLAAFMAGLALGGVVLGRMADRLALPLRTYGILEAGIAAAGLLLPLLLRLVDRLYVAAALQTEGSDGALNVLRIACAFAVLLVPTFFMGGTLPVLTRYVVRQAREFGPRLAWLYGINTFGAVVGALIAGFILLPQIGVLRSQLLAVGANLVIAAAAFLLDRRVHLVGAEPAAAPEAVARDTGSRHADSRDTTPSIVAPADVWPLRLAFFGTFVSGLCALALEVMWTRGIGIAIGTTTYSFTIMLAAFLVGITLGSTLHALVPLRRVPEALQFGVVLALVGATSAMVSQLVPRLPQIAVELNARFYGGAQGIRALSTLILSFVVMLVPATLMGIAFPLAGRARARLRAQFGRSVGDTVGLNTLGGIIGPLVAGFVLIPQLGLQRGMLFICGLNLGYGLLVLSVHVATHGARRQRALRFVGAAAAVASVALGLALPRLLPAWDLHTMAAFQNNVTLGYANAEGVIDVRGQLAGTQVLYYEEGRTSTVSVSEAQQSRAVLINGKSVATDHHSDLHHEYMLGHLPTLLHPQPRTALVIGLGAGLTLGGVTAHPEVEEITLVEIEEAVVGAARVFGDLNGDAVDDARVEVVVQDGRNYLKTTRATFDVITADPIHPWAYGAAYLYTVEYYGLIRERLEPGGVMCQWMPLYELSADNLRSITASFAANFEHNLLFQTAFDAVLIGSNEPIRLDMAQLARRLQHDEVASQLSRIGLDDALSFLVELTMDDLAVRRFAEDGRLNTDDNLYLEFSSPLSIGTPDGGGNITLIDSYRTDPRGIVGSWGDVVPQGTNLDALLADYMWAKRQTVAAAPHLEEAIVLRGVDTWRSVVERLRNVHERVPAYGRARVELAQALTGLGRELHALGDHASAEQTLREAIEIVPHDAYAHFALGSLYLDAGQPEQTVAHLRRALQRRARFPRGALVLGQALMRLGKLDEALIAYERAVQTEPENARAHVEYGVALWHRQRHERAAAAYERALDIDPTLADAAYNLSLVYEARARHADAVRVLRRGLRAAPDQPRLAERLAWILATTSDPDLRDASTAADVAERLVQSAEERLPEALEAQAAAYAALGRFDDAVRTAQRAADLAQQRNDPRLASRIREQIKRYQAGTALRL